MNQKEIAKVFVMIHLIIANPFRFRCKIGTMYTAYTYRRLGAKGSYLTLVRVTDMIL